MEDIQISFPGQICILVERIEDELEGSEEGTMSIELNNQSIGNFGHRSTKSFYYKNGKLMRRKKGLKNPDLFILKSTIANVLFAHAEDGHHGRVKINYSKRDGRFKYSVFYEVLN